MSFSYFFCFIDLQLQYFIVMHTYNTINVANLIIALKTDEKFIIVNQGIPSIARHEIVFSMFYF